jgi:hypothetical protein
MSVIWIAYCPECKKQIEACPNGVFAEACARMHSKDTGHKVLLGLEVSA